MNIKRFNFHLNAFFVLFLLIFIVGCGKQENKKLAQNYYKMAIEEVQDTKNGKEYAYKKAIDYIDEALKIDQKTEYLAFKATLLFELGYDELGDSLFDIALQKTKDEKLKCEIFNNKACLLAQVGILNHDNDKIDYAFNIWQNLINNKDYLTPEVALFNQSKVYVFKNDYELAKNKLLKAIQLSPNYIDAHYYLALVYHNLSDIKAAKNEINTVLYLFPEHESAKRLMQILKNL
ncbi:tetratricopeptide repeat protein [Candidatus Dependentiae bacterium]|nr:tetratricopeptide repeat protein [Candidatus Dependentiae bacterium]MBU4386964.1 tetratricopeptide repeat protein [Candidatus Dependentiae bacterium]MCG2756719.1 tetratricopeptide repeat protein [Candidatus Dependentiae bacterium]